MSGPPMTTVRVATFATPFVAASRGFIDDV
jgi:hypothetical protein